MAEAALIMSKIPKSISDPQLCAAPWQVMELATAFCLAPVLDSGEPSAEAERLNEDVEKLKRDLDILFSDDMRRQVLQFVKYLDENRGLYRRTLLLWLDLTEEVALQVEEEMGDNTGPVKLRRVRGGLFYLFSRFTESMEIPSIPRYINRLVLQAAIRGTVEFIITLVNVDKIEQRTMMPADVYRLGLWHKQLERTRLRRTSELKRTRRNVVKRAAHATSQWRRQLVVFLLKLWEPLIERCTNWILDVLLAPPRVPAGFKIKIDVLIADMTANAPPGMPPPKMLGRCFLDVMLWIGQHGKEMRAAIDAFSIAVHWTDQMGEMSREERIRLIEDALILYFEDIGLRGPYFRFVLRLLVDVGLDAIVFLYQKRGVLSTESLR